MHRVFCAFAGLLYATTWRLWTPQTAFPRVPLFAWAASVPDWGQWLLAVACGASLVSATIVGGTRRRIAFAVWAVCLAGLFVTDQHRLQPWAWQFWLMAVVFALAPRNAAGLLRILTVSIYAHSACSKLSGAFARTIGDRFVQTGLQLFGLSPDAFSNDLRLTLAWLLPLGELLVAALLLFRRTRRAGLFASIALHAALIALLGPWGMDHSAGVLLWNAFFIAQNAVLFRPREGESLPQNGSGEWATRLATAFVGVAMALPVLWRFGYWDAWPSWAVYAATNERVVIEVRADALPLLPDELPHEASSLSAEHRLSIAEIAPESIEFVWRRLNIDAWSLRTLGVPVYPETRFRLGVARALAERLGRNRLRAVIDRGPGTATRDEVWFAALDYSL